MGCAITPRSPWNIFYTKQIKCCHTKKSQALNTPQISVHKITIKPALILHTILWFLFSVHISVHRLSFYIYTFEYYFNLFSGRTILLTVFCLEPRAGPSRSLLQKTDVWIVRICYCTSFGEWDPCQFSEGVCGWWVLVTPCTHWHSLHFLHGRQRPGKGPWWVASFFSRCASCIFTTKGNKKVAYVTRISKKVTFMPIQKYIRNLIDTAQWDLFIKS